MKLIMVILLLLVQMANAQKLVFQPVGESGRIYTGIGCHFTLTAKHFKNKYRLVSDAGRITIIEPGRWRFVPDTPVLARLKLIRGNRIIDSASFQVYTLPQPLATIGGIRNDTTAVAVLKAQAGIGIYYSYYDTGICYQLGAASSFDVVRSGQADTLRCKGLFAACAWPAFVKQVQPGDLLYFFNIKARNYEGKELDAVPFWIRIK